MTIHIVFCKSVAEIYLNHKIKLNKCHRISFPLECGIKHQQQKDSFQKCLQIKQHTSEQPMDKRRN
jgi:hypothetical protein